ncbi:DNA primase family protein [Microbacterium mcarthurae (nom. nud.)]|uniref:Phage/plasmid primase, P4 family n=1 Tax=Microbacterium mcarthurae TaxID=3035918 RepID=A0ABW9GFC2_9MICO
MTEGKLDATLIAEWVAAPDLAVGHDGDYYEYRDGIYVRDPHVVTRLTAQALGRAYTPGVQRQVEAHLHNQDVPRVGVRSLPSGYLDYIVLENGVYWWRERELRPHQRSLGAITKLPIRFDAVAASPAFDRWLLQVLGDDAEMHRHIWEVLGYLLMTGNPLQKIVLLIGEGGNGKGTFLRVLGRLLGEENFSSVSLHTLVEDRFAAASLHGMIANISGDLSSRFLNEPEILKQVTGGDAIQTARKYGQMFKFVPYAVPVFAANEPFRTSDSSYGWRRRWEVIEFSRHVLGSGEFNEQHLFDEASGIFNRAMEGLRRLMDRGRFDPPTAAQEATTRLHDAADPFMLWIAEDENVFRGPDHSAERDDVFKRYRQWCRDSGYQPVAKHVLGRRLNQIGITSTQTRAGGRARRLYVGIGVNLLPDD